MGKLTGKTALITGASKGIGEGIARTFLKHGAKVILAARGAAVEELAAQLGENAMAVRMDVSDPASVKAGVEAAQAAFGPIDILVSNAGICKLGDFLTQSDEDRDAHLDINVKGAWNTCKAVIPGMLERKWGKIVIMSSVTGDMVADPGEAAYAMSKAALVGLTKALAREFAPTINVNAICPGYVLTPMQRAEYTDEMLAVVNEGIPMKRHAQPEEVAALYAFLASDEAKYITGQHIPIDGGETA